MKSKLTFLGATGTVTGSKYLIENADARVLVDCGLFQGFKQLRLRNWAPLPIDPATVGSVVLTHAHLDHSGYLPLFVRNGFSGPVYATQSTMDLCTILLRDSGYLQEREANFANRHRTSKHKPALPLYTIADADEALTHFHPQEFDASVSLFADVTLRFRRAGHILGASIVEFERQGRRIVFSGDLGRPNSPTMVDPAAISVADYLIVESTYGNRRHSNEDPEDAIAKIIDRTAGRGGTVLIPSFAVGRTQTLLFHLERLKAAKRIPDLPIYLDSPMAIDATEIFHRNKGDHRLSKAAVSRACKVAHYVHTPEESKTLNANDVPKVIISASGMATGGRVLHHLKDLAPDHQNTILFAGFQAGGTRGEAMVAGAKEVRIHGQMVPIRAEISNLQMLSAHADADEIMSWLGKFERAPKMTFVTHGEPAAADALRYRIEHELDWPVTVPDYKESFDLEW
jgi:metallo-beta-lactamase family protein